MCVCMYVYTYVVYMCIGNTVFKKIKGNELEIFYILLVFVECRYMRIIWLLVDWYVSLGM